MASADKIEAVLVHGEAGDAVEVGHHAVHHLARIVVIEPDVSVLVPRDGQGQRGVGQHGVDGPDWLTRHRVLAGVELHHHSGRLGVVDYRCGVAEADHELAQVPGDPVTAGGDAALLGLAQGGHQALAGGGRGPELHSAVSRAGKQLLPRGVVAQTPDTVLVTLEHIEHHAGVIGVVRVHRGRGNAPASH